MKQKTCIIKDIFDAVKFLDEIKKSSDYLTANSVLVNIFTERTQSDYIEYLSGLVRESLAKAKISGLTCQFSFAQGQNSSKTSILTVLFFYKSDVQVIEYDFSKISVEAAKDEFLKIVKEKEELKGIQAFTTTYKNPVSNDFLNSISKKISDIPIFGAEASFDKNDKEKKIFVFGEKVLDDAIVITLFSGKNLRIIAESTLGWTPIGKQLKATEVIDNHILKTIDNQNASEIYKKYLGVSGDSYFVENTCEFPFMLQRGDIWLARVPVLKDKNGYIHFTADIKKGEKFLFSYGSKKSILKESFNLAEYMSGKNLEALLLHVCKNRFMYLKEDVNLEIAAFSNFYRETAGCLTFGEILYKNKSGGIQNSALLAVGFRELDDKEIAAYKEDCFIGNSRFTSDGIGDINLDDYFIVNKNQKQPVPFDERVVRFLQATSQDLYLLNKKLEESATIDGLTNIFNRKKISERIAYELKKLDKARKINLIMFDIDNFKHINDTYGHDMGDEVLIKIADTAKKCIRPQDSIGRWGGEEFMILLPQSKKETAVEIAEKIRKSIEDIKWEKIEKITISLGVTEVREDDDLQSFYKRVDNRLYYAKQHGKNRVVSEDVVSEELD